MAFVVLLSLLLATWAVTLIAGDNVDRKVRVSKNTVDMLRTRIAAVGGCNANICFALDATSSISSTQYRAQKEFVLDVLALLGVEIDFEVAVGQYGTTQPQILPLTDNITAAVRLIEGAERGGPGPSFPVGVAYCLSQLARRPGEANKLVVFGDGSGSTGESIVTLANIFRSATNGDVCAVGVGTSDESVLLRISGGDASKVFEVGPFLEVLSIEDAIIGLVEDVCL